MSRSLVVVLIAVALAGCTTGARPAFELRIERYSYGERTPANQYVPPQEVMIYQGGCVVCGSGVSSGGTGSVSGMEFGPDGYPRPVNERIR
jgi:hypothetical protein